MIINLQEVTNDHPIWRDWRIVDEWIQWHDGSIRLHGNTLQSYEWSMNMTSGLAHEIQRIQGSPLKLTDLDRERIRNVHVSIEQISNALNELKSHLDIVGLNFGRPEERIKIHANPSDIDQVRRLNKFGGI